MVQKNHELNFENVIFSDECHASLDGPDGLARGWVMNGVKTSHRMRRQQGGGGVLFCAAMHKKR